MNRLALKLAKLPQRTLWLAASGTLLLILAQGYLLLVRGPLNEFLHLRRATGVPPAAAPLAREARARIDADAASIEARVRASLVYQAPDQFAMDVIDRIGRLPARAGVALGGVRPATPRRIGPFEELAFDLRAAGDYHALSDWLRELERELHPLVVAQLSMRLADVDGSVRVDVRFAGYRQAGAGEVIK